MAKKSKELTLTQLATLSREELTMLWLEIRQELEEKDPTTLTDDEKNRLILAIFYTTPQ